MNKQLIGTVAGAFVGVMAAPYIRGMMGIETASGFGMDDVVDAAVIVLAIILAHQVVN